MKKLLLLGTFAILLASTGFVIANNVQHTHTTDDEINHGGRTNSSGCHNDRKNGGYHCH